MTHFGELENPCLIRCGSEEMVGILHSPVISKNIAVIFVVGGPQYRVGSHRQFVLLAREFAAAGITALRFDYRGMGDSGGENHGFKNIGSDIRSAVDWLVTAKPGIINIYILGLCDGATAAVLYSHKDYRIQGLILLNPWLRSERTHARSLFFYYYKQRILDLTAWRKVLFNPNKVVAAFLSLVKVINKSFFTAGDDVPMVDNSINASSKITGSMYNEELSLEAEFAHSLSRFSGYVLLMLSEMDITANEFIEYKNKNKKIRKRLSLDTVKIVKLDGADHTFSRVVWRDQVARVSIEWMLRS